jgi:VIT1/CCC1 family predicted Fe2+/Mn2+ transporter
MACFGKATFAGCRGFGVCIFAVVSTPSHPAEPHAGSVLSKLKWLRAGVLGANDGIVSTAGIVVGVAAASAARGPILTAGIAGLIAGAVSMALGEYVSVSTQRDTEQALLSKERRELRDDPATELNELAALYEAKGLSAATARTVAEELTDHDPFAAHAEVELGIDPEELTNPWHAALSFTVGALLPLIAILAPPTTWRIPVTVVAVLLALVITGALSAGLGGAPKGRAVARNVVGGGLALAITYAIGHLVGAAIA